MTSSGRHDAVVAGRSSGYTQIKDAIGVVHAMTMRSTS